MGNVPERILDAVKAAKKNIVKLRGQKGYDAILAGECDPPEVMRVLALAKKGEVIPGATATVAP